MNAAEKMRIGEFARWLEGLSPEDSNRALIGLVTLVLSSFKREADKIRWLTAFEKTMREWQKT